MKNQEHKVAMQILMNPKILPRIDVGIKPLHFPLPKHIGVTKIFLKKDADIFKRSVIFLELPIKAKYVTDFLIKCKVHFMENNIATIINNSSGSTYGIVNSILY